MQTLSQILEQLNSIVVDTNNMSEQELATFRKKLNNIDAACGAKMAETSTKDHSYDDAKVTEYIDDILEDGFNLSATELSDYPEFVDAQRLRKWTGLIAERVDVSLFGAKQFKIYSLRLLRSNIASARTLHDLRKAVNLMISPLQLWRDHQATCEKYSYKNLALVDQEADQFIDTLLLEIEALKKISAERKRVLDEVLVHYEEGLADIVLLRNCEETKKLHNLSDDEVAKVFGINRKKLQRMRKDAENPL